MAYQAITFERSEGVGLITLNRPDQLNAFTTRMLEELQSVFKGIARDRNVRAVVITGAGKAFCGGEDFRARAEQAVKPPTEAPAQPSPAPAAPVAPSDGPVPLSRPNHPVMPAGGPTLESQPAQIYMPQAINAPENPWGGFNTGPVAPPPPQQQQPPAPAAPPPAPINSELARIQSLYEGLILQIRSLEKPVIAAVNGVAAGTGLGLALACDIRYASDRARFIEVSIRVGLLPGGGTAYFLPRLIGLSRAMELAFAGDELAANEAERLGLISRVVPNDNLLDEVRKLAIRLAKGPTRAIGLTKSMIYNSSNLDLAGALQLEGRLVQEAAASADYREGLQAFAEKRPPNFSGS